MKVFLSWSGSASKQVALALREWLPNVIQAIEPWMSSEDIEKGERWSSAVETELATTKAGIICVTPDNRDAPWMNFEAGALSKTVEKQMVCPYLFHLKPSDLTGPLVQFQASEANKDETHKMIATLNRATVKPIPDTKLFDAFDLWWERLEVKLSAIPSAPAPKTPVRSPADLLEEILGIVRDQSRTGQELFSILRQMQSNDRLLSYRIAGIDPAAVYGPSAIFTGASGGRVYDPVSGRRFDDIMRDKDDSSQPDKRERGKLYQRRGLAAKPKE